MQNIRNFRKKRYSNHMNFIVSHIQNNLKEYLIIGIIFIIGILVGIVFVNNLSDDNYQDINSYINSFTTTLKDKGNIPESTVLKNSIYNNLSIGLILWILSSTIVGIFIIYIILFFKGFCLGYTISSLILCLGIKNGSIFVFSSLLIQNLIVIPCFIALGVSGARLYKAMMKNRQVENIKIELIRHTIFSIGVFILLIFSSILEAYISKNILTYFIR